MKAAFDAAGAVAIITGGASGIGEALAAAWARAGGIAVVFDLNRSELLDDIAGVQQVAVDVADRAAVVQAVADVVSSRSRVDALVAGAAIQPRSPVVSMDPQQWLRVMDVNLHGVVWSCQAVLPTMLSQRGGSIVIFTSGLARLGRAEASAYAASKGALISFTKSLAAEVADAGVRVNVIAPGVIDTAQFRDANPAGGEREHWARTTGIGQPADVVGPLMFMLSDAATMTGSMLTRERAFRPGPAEPGQAHA